MVEVYVDMEVDASKEQQMLQFFDAEFRPAATKFEGFIDVRMLKLRSALVGSAPPGVNYRFVITYQNEELRQKWVTSEIHQTLWGNMEKMLSSPDYVVLLFDVGSASASNRS